MPPCHLLRRQLLLQPWLRGRSRWTRTMDVLRGAPTHLRRGSTRRLALCCRRGCASASARFCVRANRARPLPVLGASGAKRCAIVRSECSATSELESTARTWIECFQWAYARSTFSEIRYRSCCHAYRSELMPLMFSATDTWSPYSTLAANPDVHALFPPLMHEVEGAGASPLVRASLKRGSTRRLGTPSASCLIGIVAGELAAGLPGPVRRR